MEWTNRLTKRDYNNVFNFTDASKFQIDNDATKTKGKTSSSTIDDDYNLNRTVVDDEGRWGWYDNEQRVKEWTKEENW